MNDNIFITIIILTFLGFIYIGILFFKMNILIYKVKCILKTDKIRTGVGTFLLLEEFKEFLDNTELSDDNKHRYYKLLKDIKKIKKNTKTITFSLLLIWVFMIVLIVISAN